MPRPAWRPDEGPPDVDPVRVAAVADAYRLPATGLVAALRRWLLAYKRWWDTDEERRQARRLLKEAAAWAEERGDAAGAAELRARLHRGTALAWRLEQRAARQPCPELREQVLARAAEARRRPPAEATEPSLTLALALLWLEHRDVLPSPGSGDVPNEFILFVDECAAALGLQASDVETRARWRRQWQRERAQIVKGLSGSRPVRP